MQKQSKGEQEGRRLSRRQILAGAATAALAASAAGVLAAPPARKQRTGSGSPTATNAPLRRYMAAAAILPDGRVLVTGGYDMPFVDGVAPSPVSSAMIFDPRSGSWSAAAPMTMQRARHAAVALPNGTVAVLGGIVSNPTASVEIYDPRTNKWEIAKPLAQPRYDHSAATDGGQIYLLGGSSSTMLSGVEVYLP